MMHAMDLAGAWPLARRSDTYQGRALIRRRITDRDILRRHGRPITHHGKD